jgi:hypothetical protein
MHNLRHTAVALWMSTGANFLELTTRIGHTRVSFTMERYGGLYPSTERRVMDAPDGMARPLSPPAPEGDTP